jgi:alginate O-acetyltransferase complex protein AlgJ
LVALGAGNEQVYLGRDGWLFYREDLDYVTGGEFVTPTEEAKDPRRAILHLNRQLADRGIRLIVVPTPVKPEIHPERFAGGDGDAEREVALRPSAFDRLVRDLTDGGVLVFDPAPTLLEARSRNGVSYLKTDTHWRPEAMELVTERLARFVAGRVDLPPTVTSDLATERVDVENVGDTTYMLGLSEGQSQPRYPPERVTITRVLNADGSRWSPDRSADVLLLGDSFTNIYSLGGMGWGDGAGFAEHLSFHLGRPVDRIVQNAGGAWATRDQLARELARGSDRLSQKRVVIFQFAERELASGDWRRVELP